MDIKKGTDELYIEVCATNNEEETMIIRKIIGEKGIHETYMDIYDKLMNMEKNVKWKIQYIRSRSVNNIY